MKIFAAAFVALLSLILPASGVSSRVLPAVQITAHFYRLTSPIDVTAIKAIGSSQTKASPSILQVSKAEMARITKSVVASGGTLVVSPKILANLDQQAKLSTEGYALDVIASNHGSDTISLSFKVSVTTTEGERKLTRSAKGNARVQEAKALLMIENPGDGRPGFLATIEAQRSGR